MRGLVVESAGMLSTVQDLGRFGHRAEGVAQCGAMDELALRVANLLAGNDDRAAAIEITFGGAAFRFESDCWIALCGADCNADLDGARVPPWSGCFAPAESTLTLRRPRADVRTILAIDGGIDVVPVLGSRSTDIAAGFGGFDGRALVHGDRIPVGRPSGMRYTD
ncbi:MAG: hypothetical protein M3N13_04650, partial [Candidatus Eremiobacteraeota bacterium]|nr:hypothetical protein [Candidatus Eremiobacteraeota bacterium]